MSIHNFYIPLLVSLSAASITQVVACSGAASDDTRETVGGKPSPASATYSDTEVFDGIFLGHGPAAALLPEVWGELSPNAVSSGPVTAAAVAEKLERLARRMREKGMIANADMLDAQSSDVASSGKTYSAVSHAEFDAKVEKLHQRVNDEDPLFFGDFARAMRSGKRPLVQSALKRAHAMLVTVGATSPGSDNTWCNKCGEDVGGGGGYFIDQGGGGGYFINGGGGFYLYNIIALGLAPAKPGRVAGMDGLVSDELVDLLADRMSDGAPDDI